MASQSSPSDATKKEEESKTPSSDSTGTDGQNTDPAKAKFNASSDPTPTTTEDSDNKDSDDDGLVDPKDEAYDPYQDPSVGSSTLAEVVATELRNGDSPTLTACREAYKQRKQN